MTNPLIYWSICHYYNSPLLRLISQHSLVDMQSRSTREKTKTNQDCDYVKSDQGTEYAPVQLVYSLDVFGCQWHARKSYQRRLEPDRIKISFKKGAKEVSGHVAPDQAQFSIEYFLVYTLTRFQVNDFDSTFGYSEGRWSITV